MLLIGVDTVEVVVLIVLGLAAFTLFVVSVIRADDEFAAEEEDDLYYEDSGDDEVDDEE